MIQPYNANSWDLNAGLTSLSTGSVSDGLAPSVAKLFVVEIATSSSLDSTIAAVSSSSRANNVPSWGDWQTPTTTVSGQVQWLNNTLCTFSALGIQKMAYWSMYDPYTMWSTYPWQLSGQDLSWNAFLGTYLRKRKRWRQTKLDSAKELLSIRHPQLQRDTFWGYSNCGSPHKQQLIILRRSPSALSTMQLILILWDSTQATDLLIRALHLKRARYPQV